MNNLKVTKNTLKITNPYSGKVIVENLKGKELSLYLAEILENFFPPNIMEKKTIKNSL